MAIQTFDLIETKHAVLQAFMQKRIHTKPRDISKYENSIFSPHFGQIYSIHYWGSIREPYDLAFWFEKKKN